jgi:hypothetical protein
MSKLKIFNHGETINLCVPTLKFAKGNDWYKWLNKPLIIKNLSVDYKKLNNTKKKQEKFFLNNKKKRLILIISTKDNIYKGVVSLSNIDMERKTCEIAVVSDPSIEVSLAPYAGLEAIAIVTTYAFEKMKIRRITGAGSLKLKRWQQRMELLGYKFNFFDNYLERSKYKNKLNYTVSCDYEDFKFIKKKRGKLWDGLNKMILRITRLPKESFQDIFEKSINNKKNRYYQRVFNL